MPYQKIEIPAEQLRPGDVQILIKGYSGRLNSGTRVEYEVVAVELGHTFRNSDAPAVLVRIRNRATGARSKNYEHVGRLVVVWRKAAEFLPPARP